MFNHPFFSCLRSKYYLDDHHFSPSLCWLPSLVKIGQEGKATFQTYINNLHPIKHQSLYSTLGCILISFIPLFERTLGDLLVPREKRIKLNEANWAPDDDVYDLGDKYDNLITGPAAREYLHHHHISIDEHQEQQQRELKERMEKRGKRDEEEEEEEDNEDDDDDDIHEDRSQDLPFPFNPPQLSPLYSLRNQQVRIITKIAKIVLTPDKPVYEGGNWHVEGMKNEGILATGIYYYDSANISDSHLFFRQDISSEAEEYINQFHK